MTPTPRPLRLYRGLILAFRLLAIAVVLALAYPLIGDRPRLRLKQHYSRKILRTLAIDIAGDGEAWAPGCLVVANHVSWLDILALNAVHPVAFVSKAEVRAWPLVGWIAAKVDTVFLRRGSRGHAKIVNGEIDALLDGGKTVAIFPEGTTTDGTRLLGFHAALLQPAVETGHPIQPVALSYHHADGSRCLAPAYVGETTLLQSFAAVLACRSMLVRVRALPAIGPQNAGRRELARAARDAIGARLGLHDIAAAQDPVPVSGSRGIGMIPSHEQTASRQGRQDNRE